MRSSGGIAHFSPAGTNNALTDGREADRGVCARPQCEARGLPLHTVPSIAVCTSGSMEETRRRILVQLLLLKRTH